MVGLLLNTLKLLCSRCQHYRPLYHPFRIHTEISAVRHLRMASSIQGIQPQFFDYFLVLDFEATCDNVQKLKPQEIIEFPVLKICGKTFETKSVFHQYVEPRVHKELTPFCTELTGIIQDMVDGQPHLEETLQKFHDWMSNEGLLEDDVKYVFVTCGDWDLKTMLRTQCNHFNIPCPDYFKRWINIKSPVVDVTGEWPRGMMSILRSLQIPHEGRHHSGIDDCRNIANIVKAIAEKGYKFKETGHL